MPKSLSDRLEDLEDEIQLLLTLKNSGGNCNIKGATVTHSDGNTKQVIFETVTFGKESRVAIPLKNSKHKINVRPSSSPSSSTEPCNIFFKNSDYGGDSFMTHPRSKSSNRMYLRNIPKLSICAPPKVGLIACDLNQANFCKYLCEPKTETSSTEDNSKTEVEEKKQNITSTPVLTIPEPNVFQELTTMSAQMSYNNPVANLFHESIPNDLSVERLQKAEKEILQLKFQLDQKKVQLSEAEQEKRFALNKTHELKQKYERLKSSKSIDLSEMEKYKKNNTDLSLKLEEESKIRSSIENRAKESIEKERKTLTKKVHKIEVKAVKSAKKVKKHANKLNKAVQERDEQIKRLSGTAAKLAKNVQLKDAQTEVAMAFKDELSRELRESIKINRTLFETKEALVKNIKELQEALRQETSKVKSLEEANEEAKKKNIQMAQDCAQSLQMAHECVQTPSPTSQDQSESIGILQSKLAESRKREQIYLDEAALLEVKLQKMKNKQVTLTETAERELDKLIKEHKNMQFKLEEAAEKLSITEEKYRAKLRMVQEEYKKFFTDFTAKQNTVIRENEELQYRLDELSSMPKSPQVTHTDEEYQKLQERCKQQEQMLKEQDDALAQKTKELLDEQTETEMLKHHSNQLQIQIELLQQTFDAFEETNDEIELQMEELKIQLKEERDQLTNKEKIISEQSKEIQELQDTLNQHQNKIDDAMQETKMVSDEAKKIAQEMRLVSLELDREIEEKQKKSSEYMIDNRTLPKTVQEKVRKLESTVMAVEKLCRHMPCGNEKHKQLLILVSSLEKKALLVKRETALRMQLLTKQKDQAVYAAKFATHKLMETVTDFQSQVQVHKKVHSMLTNLLKEKEKKLKCISYKSSRTDSNKSSPRSSYNSSEAGDEMYYPRSFPAGDIDNDYKHCGYRSCSFVQT